MPTPIMKRDVILKTSVAAATASELTVSMNANFTTSLSGTVITYEDESDDSKDEKTKYKMKFAEAGGASVGCITIKFVGNPIPAATASTTKIRATYDFDPRGTETNVTLITAPAHSFERIWKQNVRDRARNEVVDNVAKVEIAVKAETGYTSTQTLTTANNNQLVVSYAWNNPTTGAVVSGSVTFDTVSTAGTGYSLGPIRITDNQSGDISRIRDR